MSIPARDSAIQRRIPGFRLDLKTARLTRNSERNRQKVVRLLEP